MDISHVPSMKGRKTAGLLVIPFVKGAKHAEMAVKDELLSQYVSLPIATHDFTGKENELIVVYVEGQPEKRFALLGLDSLKELTVEKLRRAYANVTKYCRAKKIAAINILLPQCETISKDDTVLGVMEGLLLSNYQFNKLKADSLKKEKSVLLSGIALIGAGKAELQLAKRCASIAESVYFVRDLVNGNADDVTPEHLANVALSLEKAGSHIKTTVFDKKRIEKEKMGLLLAVNRGSCRMPCFFIILDYRGNPKSGDKTVVVGKGITFDTGGLNLKPTGSMETMKCDMAGAAAVLGLIQAASALQLPFNITGVIATTENSIGSNSYKPGDVYSSYAGTTVEIGNTDAEGRLILADALAYAVRELKPTRLFDLATLTGAVDVALGDEATGLFSNDEVLSELFMQAGAKTGERVWPLPLYPEYRELLKSDIADIKSTGGRGAGCSKAAIFLKEFIGDTPWVHLDIASTAFLSEAKRYQPKYATGVGVRLIIELLETLHGK